MWNELTVTTAVHLLTVKDMNSLYLKSESGHPDKILCCEKLKWLKLTVVHLLTVLGWPLSL